MDPLTLAQAGRIAWAVVTNRWAQLVLGVAAAYVIGQHNGYHRHQVEDDAKALAATAQALHQVGVRAQAIHKTDAQTATEMAATGNNTVHNLQKVPTYVTRKADDKCIVSAGAVRLLDYAGRDTPAPAPSFVPDAPSDVALSDIVSADIENAGSFNQLVERVKGWESWYAATFPEWDGRLPPSAPGRSAEVPPGTPASPSYPKASASS